MTEKQEKRIIKKRSIFDPSETKNIKKQKINYEEEVIPVDYEISQVNQEEYIDYLINSYEEFKKKNPDEDFLQEELKEVPKENLLEIMKEREMNTNKESKKENDTISEILEELLNETNISEELEDEITNDLKIKEDFSLKLKKIEYQTICQPWQKQLFEINSNLLLNKKDFDLNCIDQNSEILMNYINYR
jgi:hypothetical protein